MNGLHAAAFFSKVCICFNADKFAGFMEGADSFAVITQAVRIRLNPDHALCL
jgi:hypothetical protein